MKVKTYTCALAINPVILCNGLGNPTNYNNIRTFKGIVRDIITDEYIPLYNEKVKANKKIKWPFHWHGGIPCSTF